MILIDRGRVGAVLEKELSDLWAHRMLVWSTIALPLIMVLMTVGTMAAMIYLPDGNIGRDEAKYLPPEVAGLPMAQAMMVLINDQYMFYILMIPALLPVIIASHSIVGEKEGKSLEPLLATPITTAELLLGKTLAATAIPVAATWLAFAITAGATRLMAPPAVFAFMIRPAWILGMLVLAPLLSLLAVLVAVIISSRVSDVRVAQKLGSLLVLPIAGGSIVVLLGRFFLTALHVMLTGIMLLFLTLMVFVMAIDLFDRESILTRWR